MKEIIQLLPVLVVAVSMNICAGLYYNMETLGNQFDKKKLIVGIIKAVIICYLFIGTAYCFDTTDLSALGIDPQTIARCAIYLYVGKTVTSLAKILGVEVHPKK